MDFRGLNAITIKNRHPLPLISESLSRLAGAKVYTKLDLRDAYHRIRIKKGDEWKTAFRTRYGHFEYCVMPFGLANAPATFQAYINKALAGLLDIFLVVYLDDILIFSRDEESHVEHVRTVLERLRQFKLYAKASKCTFHTSQVEFLGFIVSSDGISIDPARVEAIAAWPEPECIFDVQQFVGFANFYRRFIESYSKIMGPLNALVRGPDAQKKGKNKKKLGFCFNEAARKAFQEIKEIFQKAPLLAHFDPLLRTLVESDASGEAIGAICSQLQKESGAWKPIAFFSRKMRPEETRYGVGDQEMLAIVEAFREWRHFLEGNAHQVLVKTDHANLTNFMTTKELSRRQARWAEYMASFDFAIVFRAGSTNPADAPSRRPDYMRTSTHDEQHQARFMHKLEEAIRQGAEEPQEVAYLAIGSGMEDASSSLFALVTRKEAKEALAGETPLHPEPQESMRDFVRKVQMRDTLAQKKLAEIDQRGQGGRLEGTAWSMRLDDGLLRCNGKVYIPQEPALIAEIMRIHHDDPQAGHYRARRTKEAITTKYWWHDMHKSIREYVNNCPTCQLNAVHRHKPYGLLEPLPVPQRPAEWMSVDFITGLPPAKWQDKVYDALMVVVDMFTKYSLYVPCTKDVEADGLATLFYERVMPLFGMPGNLVSDRGTVFTSEFWSSFCFLLATRRRLSTAYHPQTDGQTERQNQSVEYYLRGYIN